MPILEYDIHFPVDEHQYLRIIYTCVCVIFQKKRRIRFATWNIGTLTHKSMKLADTMKKEQLM